jgi:hypothetical protein
MPVTWFASALLSMKASCATGRISSSATRRISLTPSTTMPIRLLPCWPMTTFFWSSATSEGTMKSEPPGRRG